VSNKGTIDKQYLAIEHLIHLYNHKEVLNIPSLSFDKGRIYALVGPNGAGKTTLMFILSLLLKPTSGRVVYRGTEIMVEHSQEMRGRITMLFQDPVLFNTSVQDNVEYGLKIQKKGSDERHKRAEECLEMVGLKGFNERRARELSSGEAQRVAIARALAIRPEIFLLDEPTAGMALEEVPSILELLKQIKNRGDKTILLVEHKMDVLMALSDSIAVLHEGKLIANDTPEAISKNKEVQEAYFGGGRSRG